MGPHHKPPQTGTESFRQRRFLPHTIPYLKCKQSWTVPDAGYVQANFTAELQSALDDKGQLLSEYLRKCDRCWLLIVADGRAPSSLFEPSAETRHHMYRSFFERVFYLEAFSKMLVELTVE